MQTGRLWQIRAKKERFVVKLYYTKIAACLQKGAVPIKKQRHYKFIAVCIAFLLCLGFPFSALAMQKDGYHHVDWPDFCFQVWDVAMTGQEAYELELSLIHIFGKRSSASRARSGRRLWETQKDRLRKYGRKRITQKPRRSWRSFPLFSRSRRY